MKRKNIPWASFLMMGGGIALIVAGLGRGELPQLFNRGVNLCLACIGIG